MPPIQKKTRQRLWILFWLAIAAGGLALWFVSPLLAPPRASWRAPVSFQVPSIALPDELEVEMKNEEHPSEKQEENNWLYEEPAPPAAPDPVGAPSLPQAPQAPQASALAPDQIAPPPALPPAAAPPKAEKPSLSQTEPRIALIIDDMGLAVGLSQRAMRLAAPVTLSFLPYASRLQEQVDEARAKGHEIMLHLPMEPLGAAHPGPGALLASMPPQEIEAKTRTALDSFTGYRGVNNHMGSKLTQDRSKMDSVIQLLHERDLYFIDSRTAPRSQALAAARAAGVAAAGRDIFLDDTRTPAAVRRELERLEAAARRQGQAVAIGHPHAVTLEALESWIPAARAKGYRFVPVSEIVQ